MEFKENLILIVYNKLSENPKEDEKDVIIQVKFVKNSLEKIGFNTENLALTLNLEEGINFISSVKPIAIFNLVESIGGYESMLCCAPFIFESLNVPYTGSSGASIALTTNKVMAKHLMKASQIPTPEWWDIEEIEDTFRNFPVIIKPFSTHASQGIEDSSVIKNINDWKLWKERYAKQKEKFFVEKYIDGREINISLLEDPQKGVMILPIAEIVFDSFPADKPRIVGYAAKWDCGSFEYNHTPRRFLKDSEERELINKLKEIALQCWLLFSLKGYARVDLRIDEEGNIFVLEVNANPCLSPDAGFIAACSQYGLSYEEVIKNILYSALKQN